MRKNIKRIAVLTSGGDAPGMNAALEGLVTECQQNKIQVIGFYDGYQGLLENRKLILNPKEICRIANIGGSILGSMRSKDFETKKGRTLAKKVLEQNKIDVLVVIGGDGTMRGANDLSKLGVRVVGIPATIDNDLFGTDDTLGYKTAANVIVESLENLRNTADSCKATYLVYTMGRRSGFLALRGAISGRADSVLVPEKKISEQDLIAKVNKTFKSGARSHLIVISEAYFDKNEKKLQALLKLLDKKTLSSKVRLQDIGYLQRGSNPIEHDIYLGLTLGTGILKPLLDGKSNFMLGVSQNSFCFTPLADTDSKMVNPYDLILARRLNLL
ncbi:MAG: ATP-dependent 6-phosphofructokinase [Candidatus Gracilibacteria bacterium]|nr:ATP-dependent 6-phosphofructokinase [Candidatus Gracilibacteria bacterium]